MYRSFLSLLALLPLITLAHPTHHFHNGVKTLSDANNPTLIPLTKRAAHLPTTEAGVVRPAVLKNQLTRVTRHYSKLSRGFAAYEKNTGNAHPSDTMGLAKLDNVKRDPGAGTGPEPLTEDLGGILWQGEIQVGTPPRTFTGKDSLFLVDFDTGSSDLYLPGQNCRANCQGHTIYDTSASSTAQDLKKKFNLAFGDGSTVQGEIFTDIVTIAGITAMNQAVGAATQYSAGNAVDQFPPDGLMGMAFEELSSFGANPFFQTILQQGQGQGQGSGQSTATAATNASSFAAQEEAGKVAQRKHSSTKHAHSNATRTTKVTQPSPPLSSQAPGPPTGTTAPGQSTVASPQFGVKLATNGSELLLGGVDTSAISGDFIQVPVTQVGFWQVTLDSANVDSKPVVSQLSAIVDTGTTLIVGDTTNVAAFYAAIPGSKDASTEIGAGFFTVPCNAIPDISLTFAGKSFAISPDTFNIGSVSETDTQNCVGGVVAMDMMQFWVIGDVFLQNVYTSFNVGTKEVGFANLA